MGPKPYLRARPRGQTRIKSHSGTNPEWFKEIQVKAYENRLDRPLFIELGHDGFELLVIPDSRGIGLPSTVIKSIKIFHNEQNIKGNLRRTRPRDLNGESRDGGGLVMLVKVVELENLLKNCATRHTEQREGWSSFCCGSLLGLLRFGALRSRRLTKR